MSEEEKKAIELLKKLQKKTPYIIWGDGTPYNKSNQIQTILNLVEKLQKEIEDIKIRLQDTLSRQKNTLYFCIDDYVSKDKIREIFQFHIERDSLFNDNPHKMAVIRLKDILKELLEE